MTLQGVTSLTVFFCVMALFAITAGTLYQKKYCPRFDLRSGAIIQFTASLLITLPFAIWLEDLNFSLATVQWTPRFIVALLWSILALSIGAMFLLYALIRNNAATHVSSLMYLTPPLTAMLAWLLFSETFTLIGIAGMLLAVTGVAFVVKK
jgi:drug/metabolite transporter (DMT)-like permease